MFTIKKFVLKWEAALSVLVLGAMFWACSSSSSSPGGEEDVSGGASGDMGVVAMQITGVAQKGPFVEGSAVTVRGIDCETMELTGEVFESAAESGKGEARRTRRRTASPTSSCRTSRGKDAR